MAGRAADWMRQAERDLGMAREARRAQVCEWACFCAHQAAEKAVKAVYEKLHAAAWGHAVSDLLAKLPENDRPPPALVERAKELDRHYVPARYPNGYDRGAPMDFYGDADAERAIDHAAAVVEHCQGRLRAGA